MKLAECLYCSKKYTKQRNESFCSNPCRSKYKKLYNTYYYKYKIKFDNSLLFKWCKCCGYIWLDFMDKNLFTGRCYCSVECAKKAKAQMDKRRYKTKYYKTVHRTANKAYYVKKNKDKVLLY